MKINKEEHRVLDILWSGNYIEKNQIRISCVHRIMKNENDDISHVWHSTVIQLIKKGLIAEEEDKYLITEEGKKLCGRLF